MDNDSKGFLIACLIAFLVIGSGSSSDESNPSKSSTCSDGIDNDGDGFTDFPDDGITDDWDCDPDNPNYTGEEDGNSNSFQGNTP